MDNKKNESIESIERIEIDKKLYKLFYADIKSRCNSNNMSLIELCEKIQINYCNFQRQIKKGRLALIYWFKIFIILDFDINNQYYKSKMNEHIKIIKKGEIKKL